MMMSYNGNAVTKCFLMEAQAHCHLRELKDQLEKFQSDFY